MTLRNLIKSPFEDDREPIHYLENWGKLKEKSKYLSKFSLMNLSHGNKILDERKHLLINLFS